MKALHGRHVGETAMIVGSGPSLLRLTASDFGPGPVISLNQAILRLRTLRLGNPMYVMQKDGCMAPHTSAAPVPLGCVCPKPWMLPPLPSETLLLSAAESSRCFMDHPLRYVFDVEADFGWPWYRPSAPVAVRIAQVMGCVGVRMLAHDAYSSGDLRRVQGSRLTRGTSGYVTAGALADATAREAGMAVEWVPLRRILTCRSRNAKVFPIA